MNFFAAFSTSSPLTSVALFNENGRCVASAEKYAPQTASNAALTLLEELMGAVSINFERIRGYMADTGPGSFTGIKVGVMLAKTFAFASNSPVSGTKSFDLISLQCPSAIQIRKGYYLCRNQDGMIFSCEEPSEEIECGYGTAFNTPYYPHARRFEDIFNALKWVSVEELLPTYIAEPNISQPKGSLSI